MLAPLLTAAAAAGTGTALQSDAWKQSDLQNRKVLGVSADKAAMGIGLVGAFLAPMFGIPLLAPILLGVAAGGWNAYDGMKRARTAVEEFMADRMLPGPGQAPQLPGVEPEGGRPGPRIPSFLEELA